MAGIPSGREVRVQWVAGSLGLYEEEAESILGVTCNWTIENILSRIFKIAYALVADEL